MQTKITWRLVLKMIGIYILIFLALMLLFISIFDPIFKDIYKRGYEIGYSTAKNESLFARNKFPMTDYDDEYATGRPANYAMNFSINLS